MLAFLRHDHLGEIITRSEGSAIGQTAWVYRRRRYSLKSSMEGHQRGAFTFELLRESRSAIDNHYTGREVRLYSADLHTREWETVPHLKRF